LFVIVFLFFTLYIYFDKIHWSFTFLFYFFAIKGPDRRDKHVTGIETENGQIINCLYFINCTGIWPREFGFQCKIINENYK